MPILNIYTSFTLYTAQVGTESAASQAKQTAQVGTESVASQAKQTAQVEQKLQPARQTILLR